MQSFISDLQINSPMSFYVYENHTVTEAFMRTYVLQIHVPSLKYRSAVW